jgi:hypothetical protein
MPTIKPVQVSVEETSQNLLWELCVGGENDPLEVALTKDSKNWSAGKRGCNSDFNSPLTPYDWNRPTYGIKVCIKESWCAVSRVAYRFEEAHLGMFAMKLVTN